VFPQTVLPQTVLLQTGAGAASSSLSLTAPRAIR
jgi:hypothetical protein